MNEHEWLAEQFEADRSRLRALAYRMLGSLSEADDAVQDSWLRLSRAGTDDVNNIGGWMTTVVARVCLDMLRTRTSRRENLLGATVIEPRGSAEKGIDPEYEALLADSIGQALLVVLDRLDPAERLAFVLHDVFAVPFAEIAPIVERSPTATRQLASRARRRVRGKPALAETDLSRQREVVEAFLAASKSGNLAVLVAALDPDVVMRSDNTAVKAGSFKEVRGAAAVAKQFAGRARSAQPALVNGVVGIVVAPFGRLRLVLGLTFKDGKISEIEAFSDPERVQQLELAALNLDRV